MLCEPILTQKSDDDLLALVDRPMVWTNDVNGISRSLREGLLLTAQISAQGRTPFRLQSPEAVVIDHPQMLRLWRRLGLVPS